MGQGKVDEERAKKDLDTMADRLERERYTNDGGFLIWGEKKNLVDDPPERRDEVINAALDREVQ